MWLVAAVTVAALYTLTIALTGGFSIQVAGIRVRSHSWVRPGMVALACVAMLALTVRDRIPSISLHLSRVLESAGFAAWLARVRDGLGSLLWRGVWHVR